MFPQDGSKHSRVSEALSSWGEGGEMWLQGRVTPRSGCRRGSQTLHAWTVRACVRVCVFCKGKLVRWSGVQGSMAGKGVRGAQGICTAYVATTRFCPDGRC